MDRSGPRAGDVSAVATGAASTAENEGNTVIDGLKSAAIDFFHDMKL